MGSSVLEQWHGIVRNKNTDRLEELLADDVVFHSPVVHTPQLGKAITKKYLEAATIVLANDSFKYVKEIEGPTSALLEFTVEIEGIQVNGIDLISWNDAGKICEFKVFLRPLKAVNLVHQFMGAALQAKA